MKIKSLMMMAMASMAFVFGMSSCGNDDDEQEVAIAAQVAGSYSGNEVVVVMGEESSNETRDYEFTKTTDASVDMIVPEMGMGMMTIPSFSVKNIPLTKNGNTVTGSLASFAGIVTNTNGDEKAYTVSNIAVIFSDKNVAVTYSLKYGNMPMSMETTFTGTKK